MRRTMVQMVAWMRKDLYALRWLAVTVAVLTTSPPSLRIRSFLPAIHAGSPTSILGQAGGLLVGVMFLGWWALTERLMHTDPVAGDREPWFTLPVSRRVLTSSKLALLFLLLFVPHIAGDVALAAYVHADFVPIIASVVPRVVFFFAVIVLPAVVLSALTRNLSQFFVAIIASVLILYGAVVLIAGISPNPQWLRVSGDAPWIPQWTLVLVGLFIGVGIDVLALQQSPNNGRSFRVGCDTRHFTSGRPVDFPSRAVAVAPLLAGRRHTRQTDWPLVQRSYFAAVGRYRSEYSRRSARTRFDGSCFAGAFGS